MNKKNIRCSDASLIVWLLWEGASDPFDDDVGSVVSGPDTLLQLVLLDQRREESWLDRRAKGQTCDHPSPPKTVWGAVSINASQVTNGFWEGGQRRFILNRTQMMTVLCGAMISSYRVKTAG